MIRKYALLWIILTGIGSANATDFKTFVPALTTATAPYGATDYFPLVAGAGTATRKVPGNTIATLADTQTLTNKILNGSSNTFTNIPTTALTGALQAAQFPALTGDLTTSAGALGTTLATVNATVGTYAAGAFNAKGLMTGGSNLSGSCTSSGAVISCLLAGTPIQGWSASSASTRIVTGTGAYQTGHAAGFDVTGSLVDIGAPGSAAMPIIANGHIIANATGGTTAAVDTVLATGAGLSFTASGNILTLNQTVTLDPQSGNSPFALPSSDAGKTVLRTNTITQTDTVAAATGTGLGTGFGLNYITSAVGNTITPTTSTIGGRSSLALGPNQYASISSDGVNYRAALGVPVPATQNGTTALLDTMQFGQVLVSAGNNTLSGVNTFAGAVIGSHSNVAASGNLDLSATGGVCFKTIHYTGGSAGTLTVLATAVPDCDVQIDATAAGLATVAAAGSGSIVGNATCLATPRTKASHSIIKVHVESNAGSAPVLNVSGDCG